ncbi:MAG: CRISPR-associated endonuclease Cas1 [Sandaracinaceae bacterium]
MKRSVYIAHDGATLRREGELLVVTARREKVSEVPLRDVEQLVLLGNVTVTPAAMASLADRGIDTVFLAASGRYRARLVGAGSSNVRLRLAQYRAFTDDDTVRDVARRIVRGKIAAQRVMLLRWARRTPDDPEGRAAQDRLVRAQRALRAALVRLELADTPDEIRGVEGSASAAYFRALGAAIRDPGFRFDGRNRRPPLDPVNALLSLGYTLLLQQVESAIQVVGLDPWLGTLHAPLASRPSLACDLMEEHRAPLVDALVVAAIAQQAFRPDDFEEVGPGEPVLVKRATVRWMVTLFERRLQRKVLVPELGVRLTYRDLLVQQTRKLARHVLGEEPYEPWVPR